MEMNKVFKTYVVESDLEKGKVLPLDYNSAKNTVRMRLDSKDIYIEILDNQEVSISLLNKDNHSLIEKIGNPKNSQEVTDIITKVKEITRPKYHYSLDNLLKGLVESI